MTELVLQHEVVTRGPCYGRRALASGISRDERLGRRVRRIA
jgi:hypothetical protein